MIAFEVKDMSCNHCVNTITEAVKAADGGARLEIDLEARQVRIEAAAVGADALAAAIREAGYTPERLT